MTERDIPRVDRILSTESDVEEFGIAVDLILWAHGQPSIDDEDAARLLRAGYTAAGAADLIMAARCQVNGMVNREE